MNTWFECPEARSWHKRAKYIHGQNFIYIYITAVFSDSFNFLLPISIPYILIILAENKLICRNITMIYSHVSFTQFSVIWLYRNRHILCGNDPCLSIQKPWEPMCLDKGDMTTSMWLVQKTEEQGFNRRHKTCKIILQGIN